MLLKIGLLWKMLALASGMLTVRTVSGFCGGVFFVFFFFFFSDDKAEPGGCRSTDLFSCRGWIQTLGPLKAKLSCRSWKGSGGRGPWLGIAGRWCEVGVGERAVPDQVPLGG